MNPKRLNRRAVRLGSLIGCGLLLAACGSGDGDEVGTPGESEPTTQTAEQASGPATSEQEREGETDETVVLDVWEQVNAEAAVWRDEMLPVWVTDCETGDLYACDFLWFAAPRDSTPLEVGMTCGGLNEPKQGGTCVPKDDQPVTEGDHPLMDQFTGDCRDGDLLSCRKLRTLSSGTSAYYVYAEECISELRAENGPCSVEMKESIFD